MRIWGKLWRGAVVTGVMCAAIVGGLHLWVDPNAFKAQIVRSVRETSGRELHIPGDLDLNFFPYLSLGLGTLELGNAPGFEGAFLSLKSAHLKVRLLPLLLSRLEVVAVEVDGLVLRLTRDAHGLGNWQDLAAPAGSGHSGADDVDLAKDERVPVLASLIVDGLRVSDAAVIWRDARDGRNLDVSGIGINVSNFAFGEPFDVKTKAIASARGITAEMDVSTKAVLELNRLILENVVMSARLTGASLPGSPESIAFDADFFSTDGRLDNARFQGLGLDVRSDLKPGVNGTVAGRLEMAPFNPTEGVTRLGLTPPVLIDPATMSRAAASCAWTVSRDWLEISRLSLNLDNATIEGQIRVTGGAKPAVAFDFQADTLDLDRYTPRDGAATNGTADGGKTGQSRVEGLRALDLHGDVKAKNLIAGGLHFADSHLALRAKDGILAVERFDASAYGGRLNASASMDVRAEQPLFLWTHAISGMQSEPLLRALIGQSSLTGTMESTASLRSRGLTEPELMERLQGHFQIKIRDGALKGVNINQQLRDGIRELKGEPAGPDLPRKTEFSMLSGSGTIVDGVQRTSDLLLLAPRFTVTGSGQANLVREHLDFNLMVALDGTDGKFEDGALGLQKVPLRVSGPFRNPSVEADTMVLIKALGLRGGKAVQGVLEGVGSGLNEGAKGLKKIFQ